MRIPLGSHVLAIAWECLSTFPEEKKEMDRRRDIWTSLLLPWRECGWAEVHGWMDRCTYRCGYCRGLDFHHDFVFFSSPVLSFNLVYFHSFVPFLGLALFLVLFWKKTNTFPGVWLYLSSPIYNCSHLCYPLSVC